MINIQVEIQDREAAEASMDHEEYIAFLHFPKNYTNGFKNYIHDRQHFDLESRIFVHFTNESKYS